MKTLVSPSPITRLVLAAALTLGAATAHAVDYTWTQNSAATHDWTSSGNWDVNGVFATGSGNTLTFFSDITTALADGTHAITTNVPATLTLNSLTLNGKGAAATGATNVTIGTSASTWTLDGTTPSVNLNGVNGSQALNYTVAANLTLAQATTAFTGNGTAGFTFSGIITGTGKAITKSGTSTLTLSNTGNTYDGGTTINANSGTVIANTINGTNKSGLGAGAVAIGSGSTLNLLSATASSSTALLNNTFTGTGLLKITFTYNGAGTGTALSGLSGFNGTLQLSNAGANKDKLNGATTATNTALIIDNGSQLYVNAAQTFGSINVIGTGNTENRGAIRLGNTLTGNITLAGSTTIGTEGGSIAGTITSGAAGTQTLTLGASSSTTGTFNGVIGGGTGTIALTNAAGTNTLAAVNTYTGATTVSGGTLKLGNAGALGDGTNNTSGVAVNGTAVFDLAGISLTAVVPLTLNSTASTADVGSLNNSAANTTATFGGAVTLQAATVVVGGGNVGSGNITLTGSITGNGKNLNKNGLGILRLSNSGTVTLGQLQANRGSIQVDSGTTLDVTNLEIGTGNSVGGGLILNGGNVTSSGMARFGQGSGSASGTLTLNSGILTVPALTKGTLTFNANFNGGTLKASADSATFFASATNAKVQAGGAVIDDGGFAITIGQSLIHDTALDTPSVTADGGLNKKGAGTLTLSAANTYTGATKITAGTLSLGNSLAIQNSALDTLNSVAGDATNGLKTTVTTLTFGGLTGDKNLASVFTTTSGGFSGVTALTLNPGTGVTNTYSGNIVNGAANMTLTKSGAGTQVLTGTHSYSGATTVQGGGKLTISGSGSINPTTGAALNIGSSPNGIGVFQYDSSATSKFGSIVVGNGNGTTGSTLNQTAGTITGTSLTLNNGYTAGGAGVVALSGGTLTISGATILSNQTASDNVLSTFTISGASTIFNASGELRLTGAPATGRHANGKLVQNNGVVNVAGTNGLVLVQGTTGNTNIRRGQYDLNGGTLNVNKITSTSTAAADAVATFNFNGGTLKPTASSTTFWASNSQTSAKVQAGGAKIDTDEFDITIAQALIHDTALDTPSVTPDGGLTKQGTGALTLSEVNTYTGATTIKAGTLKLDGSGSIASTSIVVGDAGSSSAVLDVSTKSGGFDVPSGTTVSGIGTVSGDTSITGIVAPGNSGIGTLTVGSIATPSDITWKGVTTTGANTNWKFDLPSSGTVSDKLVINGDFLRDATAGTNFYFDFTGSTPAYNTTYTLVTWTGTNGFAGFLSNFKFGGLSPSYNANSQFTFNGSSLQFTAIPELSNILIGGLLGTGLLRRRRI